MQYTTLPSLRRLWLTCAALALFAASPAPASAQTIIWDQEPNNSKAAAQSATDLVAGDYFALQPNQSGQFDPDTFRLRTAPLPPGIYRHTLTQGFADVSPRIRILGRDAITDEVLVDSIDILSDSDEGDFTQPTVAWYGFGKAEELYVELQELGSNRSSPPAQVVLGTEPVTPIQMGALAPAASSSRSFSISAVGLAGPVDTEVFVYDAEFNLLRFGWSDNPSQNDRSGAVRRPLAPGTYYAACARKGLSAHAPPRFLPFSQQEFASPVGVTDFRGALVAGSRAAAVDLSITVSLTSSPNFLNVTAPAVGPLEAAWVQFEIGTTQETSSFCPGDSSLAPCPCGEDSPQGSGAGCVHSEGRGAFLNAAFGNSFEPEVAITLEDLPQSAGALIFLSTGTQPPSTSGGGLNCLAAPLVRLPAIFATEAGNAEIVTQLTGQHGFFAGLTVYAQAAYRDPNAADGCRINLTSGMQFQL